MKGLKFRGKPSEVARLLQTANEKEQARRVQALQQAAQQPVVSVAIQFDPRTTLGGIVNMHSTAQFTAKSKAACL